MTTGTAILAGGCFWGIQDLIRLLPGVESTRVGYTGGHNKHPTYGNHPGHAEAIEITYDPTKTDYRAVWEFFFQIHDPTTKNRQGNDVGTSYRSAISISMTIRSALHATPSPRSTHRDAGPPRWSPRSRRPASSGKPNPNTKTTCSATRAATPATTCGPNGN
jgi:methionine-S-sulfoxide reductase